MHRRAIGLQGHKLITSCMRPWDGVRNPACDVEADMDTKLMSKEEWRQFFNKLDECDDRRDHSECGD